MKMRARELISGQGGLNGHLIITHKFLEPPVEGDAKAEIILYLFNTTWLATVVRKNIPKDMGNDKMGMGSRHLSTFSASAKIIPGRQCRRFSLRNQLCPDET
jgi:hypothetical protein